MANLQGPTTITGTSSAKLPQGTTAQRPTASAGMTRYNTSLGYAEYYNGTSWARLVTTRETVLAQSNSATVSATFAGNNFNLAGTNYFSSGYFGVDKSYTFTNGAAISKIRFRRTQTSRYFWWFLITTKSSNTYTCVYGALIEVPPGGTAGDIVEQSLVYPVHPLLAFGSRKIPDSGTYYLSWHSGAPSYPASGPGIYSDANSGGQIDYVDSTTAPTSGQTYTVTATNMGGGIHIQAVYGDRDSHMISDSNGYRTHAFLTGTQLFTPNFTGPVEVLVVAGGGGGGGAGGGGAGGVVYNNSFAVTAGTNYTATVGSGGYGVHWDRQGGTNVRGTNGEDSVFGSITAIGGGAGGAYGSSNTNGVAGGSGGGAGWANGGATGGAGTAGQGFAGGANTFGTTNPYSSGGGGGAGAVGGATATNQLAGQGGSGLPFTISGQTFWFGGGGGGGAQSGASAGAIGGNGGIGGGGGGAVWTGSAAAGGTATGDVYGGLNPGKPGYNFGSNPFCVAGDGGHNTGGGGGGMGISVNWGGWGGSGIILVRYPITTPPTVAIEFKNVGNTTWIAPTGVTSVEVLVVAGGGGGGGRAGSGGGGGGFYHNPAYAVTAGSTYTVVVGGGGTGGAGGLDGAEANGGIGGNSQFDTMIAYGGGGGRYGDVNSQTGTTNLNGGSGGGGGYDGQNSPAGAGQYGQGNYGGISTNYSTSFPYVKGGGGGAGNPGGSAYGHVYYGGQGGAGLPSMISGAPRYYSGGGGGGSHNPAGKAGRGGIGGGGDAGHSGSKNPGYDAVANTGGGGGGASTEASTSYKGGNGGSGIVIIRYQPA